MNKSIKILGLFIVFLGILIVFFPEGVEGKELEIDEVYKYDLDGNGIDEKIMLKSLFDPIYNSDWEGGTHYLSVVYINDEPVILEDTDADRIVQVIDINPSDKYIEIISYALDYFSSDPYDFNVYRYDNKIEKIVKSESVLKFYVDKIEEKQDRNDNLCILSTLNTIVGGVYIKKEYRIKNKKLELVRPKDNIYEISDEWSVTNIGFCVYKDCSLEGEEIVKYLDSGEKIKLYKVKIREDIDDVYFNGGLNFDKPQIISGYIKTKSGISGWIDMNPNYYYDGIIVNDARLFYPQ